MQRLQSRMDISYDSSIPEHQVNFLTMHDKHLNSYRTVPVLLIIIAYISWFQQAALRALWNAAFPEEELRDLISEQWKEMGWQGKDPSTDFRYISTLLTLEVYFTWLHNYYSLNAYFSLCLLSLVLLADLLLIIFICCLFCLGVVDLYHWKIYYILLRTFR